tara:strand:- start:4338 stop:4625 length:288 start_codon:yes stop_codon:yes gene_type:complete
MDKHREAGRNVFMGSVNGLANVLAIAVAFLVTPKFYELTSSSIRDFVGGAYGSNWTDLASFGWGLISATTIFYIARMSIGTALIMGGLAIATRFL